MKILFVTEKPEPWLNYIWSQFVLVNGLKAEYHFASYGDVLNGGDFDDRTLLIEYAENQKLPTSLFLFKRNKYRVNFYVWLKNKLPVYVDSMSKSFGRVKYDLLYNAFVHLSRIEEWRLEQEGKNIKSYASKHPLKDKQIWMIPIVNYLFNELESKIKKHHPLVSFASYQKPVIEFSHDVDYLYKTLQLRIKHTAFNIYNVIKLFSSFQFKRSHEKVRSSLKFATSSSNYWQCFDRWKRVEENAQIKSVFYFYAGRSKRYGLTKWLIDPSYEVIEDPRLVGKIRELRDSGNKIGIHGSFFSAVHQDIFDDEKLRLEKCIGEQITKNRQHWLNYFESHTPYFHKRSGIKEDSSLGFNDIPGFRAGIASKYQPYDHISQQAFPFFEIPLVLMDSHLHDYSGFKSECDFLFKYQSVVKKYVVSVDWHLRTIHPEYSWEKSYEKIMSDYRK